MIRSLLGTLLLSVLLLAGCATPPPLPKSAAPAARTAPTAPAAPVAPAAPPASPAPAAVAVPVGEVKPATLTGSEESSLLFDNFTAYVAAVDGQPVAAGREGWNAPLPLPAGPCRLAVAFNRGAFAAQGELELTARSAAVYQLKFATDAEIFGKNSYCKFWIVDMATGESVTAPLRVALTKIVPAR